MRVSDMEDKYFLEYQIVTDNPEIITNSITNELLNLKGLPNRSWTKISIKKQLIKNKNNLEKYTLRFDRGIGSIEMV